jgi:hypothetical protein
MNISTELDLASEINNGIRALCPKAARAIIEKLSVKTPDGKETHYFNDKLFTEITRDMIVSSQYSYPGFSDAIKEIIHDTCYDLNEAEHSDNEELAREYIAKKFVQKMIKCCKQFMN